jgi:hypothetical protein
LKGPFTATSISNRPAVLEKKGYKHAENWSEINSKPQKEPEKAPTNMIFWELTNSIRERI